MYSILCLVLLSVSLFQVTNAWQLMHRMSRVWRRPDQRAASLLSCKPNLATSSSFYRIQPISMAKIESTTSQTAYLDQKNQVLLTKFLDAVQADVLPASVLEFINFCDEGFDHFLASQISAAEEESEAQSRLGKIRYEINMARQRKLREADQLLRDILGTGGLKQMEAKLAMHLRKSEIDIAFMVILQMNIDDALRANAETAVQVLTHLRTLINEHQDKLVASPIRLARMLLRTEDVNVRKQMLRQKLILSKNNEETGESCTNKETPAVAMPTASPQCENIVVAAVETWGGADVEVHELQETIHDLLSQLGEVQERSDVVDRCNAIKTELEEVLAEAVSGPCSSKAENVEV